jgi:hypothetical protein
MISKNIRRNDSSSSDSVASNPLLNTTFSAGSVDICQVIRSEKPPMVPLRMEMRCDGFETVRTKRNTISTCIEKLEKAKKLLEHERKQDAISYKTYVKAHDHIRERRMRKKHFDNIDYIGARSSSSSDTFWDTLSTGSMSKSRSPSLAGSFSTDSAGSNSVSSHGLLAETFSAGSVDVCQVIRSDKPPILPLRMELNCDGFETVRTKRKAINKCIQKLDHAKLQLLEEEKKHSNGSKSQRVQEPKKQSAIPYSSYVKNHDSLRTRRKARRKAERIAKDYLKPKKSGSTLGTISEDVEETPIKDLRKNYDDDTAKTSVSSAEWTSASQLNKKDDDFDQLSERGSDVSSQSSLNSNWRKSYKEDTHSLLFDDIPRIEEEEEFSSQSSYNEDTQSSINPASSASSVKTPFNEENHGLLFDDTSPQGRIYGENVPPPQQSSCHIDSQHSINPVSSDSGVESSYSGTNHHMSQSETGGESSPSNLNYNTDTCHPMNALSIDSSVNTNINEGNYTDSADDVISHRQIDKEEASSVSHSYYNAATMNAYSTDSSAMSPLTNHNHGPLFDDNFVQDQTNKDDTLFQSELHFNAGMQRPSNTIPSHYPAKSSFHSIGEEEMPPPPQLYYNPAAHHLRTDFSCNNGISKGETAKEEAPSASLSYYNAESMNAYSTDSSAMTPFTNDNHGLLFDDHINNYKQDEGLSQSYHDEGTHHSINPVSSDSTIDTRLNGDNHDLLLEENPQYKETPSSSQSYHDEGTQHSINPASTASTIETSFNGDNHDLLLDEAPLVSKVYKTHIKKNPKYETKKSVVAELPAKTRKDRYSTLQETQKHLSAMNVQDRYSPLVRNAQVSEGHLDLKSDINFSRDSYSRQPLDEKDQCPDFSYSFASSAKTISSSCSDEMLSFVDENENENTTNEQKSEMDSTILTTSEHMAVTNQILITFSSGSDNRGLSEDSPIPIDSMYNLEDISDVVSTYSAVSKDKYKSTESQGGRRKIDRHDSNVCQQTMCTDMYYANQAYDQDENEVHYTDEEEEAFVEYIPIAEYDFHSQEYYTCTATDQIHYIDERYMYSDLQPLDMNSAEMQSKSMSHHDQNLETFFESPCTGNFLFSGWNKDKRMLADTKTSNSSKEKEQRKMKKKKKKKKKKSQSLLGLDEIVICM